LENWWVLIIARWV